MAKIDDLEAAWDRNSEATTQGKWIVAPGRIVQSPSPELLIPLTDTLNEIFDRCCKEMGLALLNAQSEHAETLRKQLYEAWNNWKPTEEQEAQVEKLRDLRARDRKPSNKIWVAETGYFRAPDFSKNENYIVSGLLRSNPPDFRKGGVKRNRSRSSSRPRPPEKKFMANANYQPPAQQPQNQPETIRNVPPPRSERGRSPQQYRGRSQSRNGRGRSPARSERERSPARQERRWSPPRNDRWRRSPARNERGRSPTKSERGRPRQRHWKPRYDQNQGDQRHGNYGNNRYFFDRPKN